MGIPSSWDYAADVVVVGYGVAGASAAITAHDAGASVIILEKSPHADSGNSGVCGGLSWFPVLSSNGGSIEDFITYMKVSQWGTVADDDSNHCLLHWHRQSSSLVHEPRSQDHIRYIELCSAEGSCDGPRLPSAFNR